MINGKVIRIVCGIALFLVALVWELFTERTVGGILLALAAYHFWWTRGKEPPVTLCLLVLAALMPLQPFDISSRFVSSGPHFVRLMMGLPTKEGAEQEQRGEIILGGCVTTGFEPKWVLVW